uniref:Uncharacterized protein n=1 Tax=Steinernema glaseri TaxID=37863 RepID=A0A1I8AWS2_9BILA
MVFWRRQIVESQDDPSPGGISSVDTVGQERHSVNDLWLSTKHIHLEQVVGAHRTRILRGEVKGRCGTMRLRGSGTRYLQVVYNIT